MPHSRSVRRAGTATAIATALAWVLLTAATLLTPLVLGPANAAGQPPAADGRIAWFDHIEPSTRQLLDHFQVRPREALGAAPILADYLGHAVLFNPRVHAAYHGWLASVASADAAGAWPDPNFSYGEMLVPVETKDGPQQRSFSLRQTVPWFGVTGLRSEAARRQADAARAGLDAALLEIIYEVRRQHAELAYLGQAIAVTGQHLGLLVQWEAVARVHYETGQGGYEQLVSVQIERATLEARLAGLEDRWTAVTAAFNRVCGRHVDAVVPVPEPPIPMELELDRERVRQQVLQFNPTLRELSHQRDGLQWREHLAAKAALPALAVGLDYIQTGAADDPLSPDSGKDPLVARFSVTLPLWGGYGAVEQAAVSRRLAAEARLRDEEAGMLARLAETLFNYDESRRVRRLYDQTLLPKGRQSLAAMEAAFQAGRVDLRAVLEEKRRLLSFELAVARAGADCLIQQAALERLTARPVASPFVANSVPDPSDREDRP